MRPRWRRTTIILDSVDLQVALVKLNADHFEVPNDEIRLDYFYDLQRDDE